MSFDQKKKLTLGEKWLIFRKMCALKIFVGIDIIRMAKESKWFLILLKSHLDTEKYICTCNGRLRTFNIQWSEIYECL